MSRKNKPSAHSFGVDANIYEASTPPAALYGDPELFELQQSRVFSRSWHWLPGVEWVTEPGDAAPITLLEGCLSEPLMLVCDDTGELRVISNVCTHRASAVVSEPCRGLRELTCPYHGRKFGLDGRFQSMPGCEGLPNFPTPGDDLAEMMVEMWGPLLFTSIAPAFSFSEWMLPVAKRLGWIPLDDYQVDPDADEELICDANWTLVADALLDPPSEEPAMETELLSHAMVRRSPASDSVAAIEGIPDKSFWPNEEIGVVEAWLFPNLFIQITNESLRVRLLEPLGSTNTGVYTRVWRRGDTPEDAVAAQRLADEKLTVQTSQIQRGMVSGFYDRGRYVPDREQALHHSHRLLARYLFKE